MTEPLENRSAARASARPPAAELSSPDGRSAASKSGLPVLPPLTAVIEILLLIVLPAALDYAIPSFPSLSEMQPHLFWLPILLVSLQYGTVSGLLAAGIAIAASALLGWSEQEPGENHFTFLLRVWSQPMLWLAAALVLGQFRMRQIEQKQDLQREVAELATQRKSIAEFAANLRQRCERLEREMVMRRGPAGRDVLVKLAHLQRGIPGQQQSNLVAEALELAFGRCQASIFAVSGSGVQLAESFGWPAGVQRLTALDATHPLVSAVVGDGRSVSVLEAGDEAALAGQGLAAVPIFSRDGTRVAGFLKLEAAEPAVLDGTLAERMQVVASALAGVVDTARRAVATPSLVRIVDQAARPKLWRHVRRHRRPAEPRQSSRAG